MSVSPAQLLQAESVGSASEKQRSTCASIPASSGASESAVPTSDPSPAIPRAQFSTDFQIDNHHQVYYEVVDDRTGSVLMEIPSEALRKIGESLDLPIVGEHPVPVVNVKS